MHLITKLIFLITIAAFSSCSWRVPVEERMGKARTAESKALLKELSRQTNNSSPSIRLTWSQALHKMYRENPELIRADYRIADAKEEQDSAWKDLTPSLTLSGSDTKSLANLGDLLGNPSLRVHSFISLGNLLDYPKH